MYARESIKKLGDRKKVADGGLSVRNNSLVGGEIVGQGRGLEIENLVKAELVAHFLGDAWQICSVTVKHLGFFARVQQADELIFHHHNSPFFMHYNTRK